MTTPSPWLLFFFLYFILSREFLFISETFAVNFGGNRLIDIGDIKQEVKCGFNAFKCTIINCQSHILSQK